MGNTPGKYFFNLDQWFNRSCHLNKSFWTDRCWISDKTQELTLSLWLRLAKIADWDVKNQNNLLNQSIELYISN